MWPSFGQPSWPMAQLFQYLFVVLVLGPVVFACARVLKRGFRAFLTSRTLLVLSPSWRWPSPWRWRRARSGTGSRSTSS